MCKKQNPIIVIEIDGSVVKCVRSNLPARVIIMDSDTESCDDDRLASIGGEEIYLHDNNLSVYGGIGLDGVDPEFIAQVIAEIETISPSVVATVPGETKVCCSVLASRFMSELLGSVETLTQVAEMHGIRTLADLMYLQNAILNGGFIDHYQFESNVLEIAKSLPSGERWVSYIKIEYMADNAG